MHGRRTTAHVATAGIGRDVTAAGNEGRSVSATVLDAIGSGGPGPRVVISGTRVLRATPRLHAMPGLRATPPHGMPRLRATPRHAMPGLHAMPELHAMPGLRATPRHAMPRLRAMPLRRMGALRANPGLRVTAAP